MNSLIEYRVERIQHVLNLRAAAQSLSELLKHPANSDVQYEFPATYERYTGDIGSVADNLALASADCSTGKKQQWIMFAGEQAVGMSVVRKTETVPELIPKDIPNVSLFVCFPFRNGGIGKLAMSACIETVNLQFGGAAWASVKHHNRPSQRLVLSAGFRPVTIADLETIYSYNMRD